MARRQATADPDPAGGLPEPLAGIANRAINESASDIHIDLWSDEVLVRFRVDGVVHTKERLTPGQGRVLLNQLKVAASIDIDIVHRPVEGHLRYGPPQATRNVRVTIAPTANGNHSAHLRFLSVPQEWRDIRGLGLTQADLERIESAMRNPWGMILAAGPTGSGKTTTLYALAGMSDPQRRVVATIEDPVEFDLPFARQLQVNEQHGLSMEQGLRALLRMDPDILLVGEIRDRDSATIASHAALAGRLVLATVHGRDAAGAVESMHYLTVPNYVLGGALRTVIGQSLVRRVCPRCARQRPPRESERAVFKEFGMHAPQTVLEPVGCDSCHGYGFRGRVGVFEVVPVDDQMGDWIARGQPQHAIRQRFKEAGARSLVADALEKVASGLTSMREILPLWGHGAGDGDGADGFLASSERAAGRMPQ
jgi:general secretion pathway protein E